MRVLGAILLAAGLVLLIGGGRMLRGIRQLQTDAAIGRAVSLGLGSHILGLGFSVLGIVMLLVAGSSSP